jgi:hypothetical protein
MAVLAQRLAIDRSCAIGARLERRAARRPAPRYGSEVCDDLLIEREARFERATHGAGLGNALQAPLLVGRQVVWKVQVDGEVGGNAVAVVVNPDGCLADIPAAILGYMATNVAMHAASVAARSSCAAGPWSPPRCSGSSVTIVWRPLTSTSCWRPLPTRRAVAVMVIRSPPWPDRARCKLPRHPQQLLGRIRRQCPYKYSSKQRCSCATLAA